MTNNQHTPGPWSIAHDIAGSILDPSGDTVARVVQYTICPDGEIQANARLIAAAPELLEALQELLSAKADQYGQPIPAWVWKKASAAIAKANLDPGGDTVARVVQYTTSPVGEIQANARLIAAAPELLEALEIAQWALTTGAPSGDVHGVIRAAISKARGPQ